MNGESFVCEYLRKNRCRILVRNYTKRGGEIDIIAENQQYILFVEVKQRGEGSFTGAAESVTFSKRQKIIRTAEIFLQGYKEGKQPRFDVACVGMKNGELFLENYIINAFDASGGVV